ncbi:MAG: DUF599 domain-containing protein [Bauldia sp.]|nr:DUF599 domain-containing protein [Bauldia sp.]
MDLSDVPTADIVAFGVFILSWLVYSLAVDRSPWRHRTLSASMDRQRLAWVEMMQTHEIRIADTNILAGLQQGTGFFASASMLAIGAALALLGSSEAVGAVLADLSPATADSNALFEAKVVGLGVIFGYAFFKFGWGYRIFNYASILIGALPPPEAGNTPEVKRAVARAAGFLRIGGRNFNRGLRSFNFAIAYLCWLAGPWALIAASLVVLAVLLHRQFLSQSVRLVRD